MSKSARGKRRPPGEAALPKWVLPLPAPDSRRKDRAEPCPDPFPEKKRHRYKRPHCTKRGRGVSKTMALRKSQSQFPRILQKLGKSLVNSPQETWDLKTHLLVVSMIYDRLAIKKSQISTRELTALAHILADQRKSLTPGAFLHKSRGGKKGAKGKLPHALNSIIDEVYGDSGRASR